MALEAKSMPTLLALATEAIVPMINGCAKIVGRRDALRFKKAIDYFGPPIAASWNQLSHQRTPREIIAELDKLASQTEEEARREAAGALTRFATAAPQDHDAAIDYLAAIPTNVARYVSRTEKQSNCLPWPLDREQGYLGFLPIHVPPLSVGTELPKTAYRLDQVLGSGELGVAYRVTNSSDPSQKRVVKFCLDNALVGSLAREREHLNRLLTLGLGRWSPGIARLYGYNLDTQIPYLVYEYCPGSDVTAEIREVREETSSGFSADKALDLVSQIAGALAFIHGRGLVYGDLKPANVIVMSHGAASVQDSASRQSATHHSALSTYQAKLTDFGTTGVSAAMISQSCPISSRENAPLVSAATHARLVHGSQTSMYMCGELRRGDQLQPHHDIYSLGVLWYQLLIGDVTQEIHPGWAEELSSEFQTPKKHVEVLQRCVGYYKRRPANAADLLTVLQSLTAHEGQRPTVTFVSERLRKLDERFAKMSGSMSPALGVGEEQRSLPTSQGSLPLPALSSIEKIGEIEETICGQETRILGEGFVPRPGTNPAQISREAELARLKRLLSNQMSNQAYDEARETLEVLLQLHPRDPEVMKAQTHLAQNR
jgi:serine/threonine protein kinase